MALPRLLKLESCLADYTVKATISGITILKQNRFRKRYTGSKTHAVDINGKLWIDAKELKKITGPEKIVSKKKGPAVAAAEPNTQSVGYKSKEFYDDLPTHERNFLTNLPDLSTPEIIPEKKGYKVHKREVRQRLLGMIHTKAGKKELYFWTVTFPKGTSDDVAYQAFNTWLTTLRTKDKFGRRFLKNYLWIAERQDGKRLTDTTKTATNTIHFHIAIPHKMPVKVANGAMQTILKNLSEKGLIPFTKAQCKKYNGVDIAKNRDTKRVVNFAIKKGARSLTNYLTKYLTKNDAVFTHLAWHNSRGFSALFTGVTYTERQFIAGESVYVDKYNQLHLFPWLAWLQPAPKVLKKVWTKTLKGFEEIMTLKPQFIVENDYFCYQPWGPKGCPPEILKELMDLNNHCQSLTHGAN